MASRSVEESIHELGKLRQLLQHERRSLSGKVANLQAQVRGMSVNRKELARSLRHIRRLERRLEQAAAEKLALLKYIRELEQFLKIEPDDKNKSSSP